MAYVLPKEGEHCLPFFFSFFVRTVSVRIIEIKNTRVKKNQKKITKGPRNKSDRFFHPEKPLIFARLFPPRVEKGTETVYLVYFTSFFFQCLRLPVYGEAFCSLSTSPYAFLFIYLNDFPHDSRESCF